MSRSNRRIAFVGDYVPRRCGIATFTHDLCEAVASVSPTAECFVGAVNDRPEGYDYSERVRFEMVEKDIDSYRRAADFLNFNNTDILCVQHEFGIYGGAAGSHLLALLKEVRMPVVTTLHTVLREPTQQQRLVLDEIAKRSNRLVVMAHRGAEILREVYHVPEEKIDTIPHGIPDLPFLPAALYKEQFGVEGKKVLLTFGLLGPAKGIEFVIQALPEIIRQYPEVVYLVLGATHPHLLANEGESYRLGLERLAEDLGIKKHVIFYNQFVSPEDLREFVGASDIYITPYLNEEQITSGTLSYVFGAGNAVVSTPYWHARELLAENRGKLVPFRDASAIASAVVDFLSSDSLLAKTQQNAYALGRSMVWPAVAQRYLNVFENARRDYREMSRRAFADWTLDSRLPDLPPLRLDHIVRMTDRTGIFQHAIFNVPNNSEGYCTDDNARAYILCNFLDEIGGAPPSKSLDELATIYLAFLWEALPAESNRFRNFMRHDRSWAAETGSEDSHARALWAAGTGVSRSRNEGHRHLCAEILKRALPVAASFVSPRAWAFTLLGIDEYLRRFPGESAMNALRFSLIDKLMQAWKSCADSQWYWFESVVSYDNARISHALIASGKAMAQQEVVDVGLASLRWLVKIQETQSGHFRPVGSNGFFRRGAAPASFDQQPIEANAMIAACLEAHSVTGDEAWAKTARRIFDWFLGRNDLRAPLYDSSSGGCRDGLHADRLNENQGAESTLAFHLSRAEMSLVATAIANLSRSNIEIRD